MIEITPAVIKRMHSAEDFKLEPPQPLVTFEPPRPWHAEKLQTFYQRLREQTAP